ncbi:MAG: putative CDP-diacylglycerol--glycerol-3-phosphate 3-phosphatidyl-transferase 2 [Firmicutes bacterium ADurb.Bin193]|nr:MAG: putative CDP-diacylglycerol--glycerol-3-phosphate 3-phosphatidyl-transferase 2 [Firmicutes bacterium ADurb.Bin193]
MNLPNVLTVVRFFLIPVFAYTYLSGEDVVIPVVVLAVSGLTDILDGYIARKYNLITKWGIVFDPIADKLTQLTVAFCIALKGYSPMWIVFGVLFVKELVMVLGGINLYKKSDVVISANWYGKVATLIFYILFFTLIISGGNIGGIEGAVMIACALALSLFALIRYTIVFFGMRKK